MDSLKAFGNKKAGTKESVLFANRYLKAGVVPTVLKAGEMPSRRLFWDIISSGPPIGMRNVPLQLVFPHSSLIAQKPDVQRIAMAVAKCYVYDARGRT
ncbi:MAG: hypothetical protein GY765_18555 [bacterium]|nr:hypothetical protein [bacterium]